MRGYQIQRKPGLGVRAVGLLHLLLGLFFVFAVGFSVAAQLKAYEAAEFEAVGSGGFTCFFYYVLDFLVGILNVGLFEQADFSIVLGNAAADDLFHDGFGLAFIQGLVAEDGFFGLEGGRVYLVAINTGGVCCGHMHGDAAGNLLEI